MKKILGILFLVILLLTFVYIKSKNVGDLRPALFPTKGDIKQLIQEQNLHPDAADPAIQVPEGYSIGVFADELGSPRDLAFSPGGMLLASVTSAGKVIALPDVNKDGTADQTIDVVSGLARPHGIAFYKGSLYVAEETKVSKYTWDEKQMRATNAVVLFSLPKGGRHFTRSLAFTNDGRLFISLGSTCDVCLEKDAKISTVLISDENGKTPEVYARGLRNAVFLTVQPESQQIWATEMGRDFLGDTFPPDEINIIREGKDYGWPICYGNKLFDSSFKSGKSAKACDSTEAPAFELPAHVAPLGLTFVNEQFSKNDAGDLLVALHGSWNSSSPVGYKIVKLDISGENVSGMTDFITGFLSGGGALGRPVDMVFDTNGVLYISDDKAGVVYLVYKKTE
ncbi:MAG: hypothetical protein RI947_730 [Candidatus Parcubacteria bacterium]|jgi:glucose/arabinose dehydrogenase